MTSEMPANVRAAVEKLMIDYCYAVDDLNDVEDLLAVFTEDATADFTAIGLPLMEGKQAIREFFTGVFARMTHHFHFIGNFRPASWDGTEAVVDAYVIGMGADSTGNTVEVQVRYRMMCCEVDGRWLAHEYRITPMMPLPGSLDEIHADG